MAFHTGVLRFLAEQNKMAAVTHVSTVSGGSLLVGVIFAKSNMTWPTSTAFLTEIHPAIRHLLTTQDLQTAAIARLLFRPMNWRFLFSRANIVAQVIHEDWKIRQTLYDLPTAPVWSINGTTAETGKRFRFKQCDFGDYEIGYAQARGFPIASAMAVSAAFPVGIGPLAIDTRKYLWMKRPAWDASPALAKPVTPPYKHLHIYDGGVYDNLGLEPLYDLGKQTLKGNFRILASDAGAPLVRGFNLGALNPFRFKRLMDVVTDQNRSLRVRAFVEFLQCGHPGAYFGIGSSPVKQLARNAIPISSSREWLSEKEIANARNYPTNLRTMDACVFDLLERHGYETALSTELAYPYLA